MVNESLYFFPEDALVDRLALVAKNQKKNIVFLCGSALTAPIGNGGLGVPNVDGMIDLIRDELSDSPRALSAFDQAIAYPNSSRYQEAFKFLQGWRGQDAANLIIKRAVLKARLPHTRSELLDLADISLEAFHQLESDITGWELSPGVKALGEISAAFPSTIGRVILTSNFDPLISISIRRANGTSFRTTLHRDGNLGQTQGDGCHVVHFHGYWLGADTLHTPRQLSQHRPQLKSSLLNLINNSIVVVVAYGGWDDIFTKTLMEIVEDDAAYPEIIWTFFHDDDNEIINGYAGLINELSPGLDRSRVTLFKGIDCNRFFPNLLDRIKPEIREQRPDQHDHYLANSSIITIIPAKKHSVFTPEACDSPPVVDTWVGRNHEVALLIGTKSPVSVITGIGGQGKSALASRCLDKLLQQENIELWDWRDCREEGDNIHTQLLSIIERVSDGKLTANQLEGHDIKSIVDILFNQIRNKNCIFVFDNIDHYIDLETLTPVSGILQLINSAVTYKHSSRFIFTCRPNISHENHLVLSIPLLKGLSLEETKELFRLRGASISESEVIEQAHSLTEGHPLWLNLIAVQVSRQHVNLSALLENIRLGKGDLPENTLRSIWGTLRDKQQYLLRIMAEAVRPETEERIKDYTSKKLTWNRFTRELRSLKALNLIVVKQKVNHPETLELHPLIKQFIRKRFLNKERESFISQITSYFDGMIGKYKSLLPNNPSLAILENWIQKAELDINRLQYSSALETIYEVSKPLIARGYAEEFIRISKRLFLEINWTEACLEYAHFDDVFQSFINTLVQFGETELSSYYLDKYASVIPGKSAKYINCCNLKSYMFWYRGDYASAIHWGRIGSELKNSSDADISFDCEHNLALAHRDSGEIEEALKYFLHGESLEMVLEPSHRNDEHGGGPYYGNIGRCLFLQDRVEEALVCYRKSALLLEEEDHELQRLNQGYSRLWIADALLAIQETDLAYCFYRAAIDKWQTVSPPRARGVEETLELLLKIHEVKTELLSLPIWQLESYCLAWLKHEKLPAFLA